MLTWWLNNILGIASPSQMYAEATANGLADMYRVMDEAWNNGDSNSTHAKT